MKWIWLLLIIILVVFLLLTRKIQIAVEEKGNEKVKTRIKNGQSRDQKLNRLASIFAFYITLTLLT